MASSVPATPTRSRAENYGVETYVLSGRCSYSDQAVGIEVYVTVHIDKNGASMGAMVEVTPHDGGGQKVGESDYDLESAFDDAFSEPFQLRMDRSSNFPKGPFDPPVTMLSRAEIGALTESEDNGGLPWG